MQVYELIHAGADGFSQGQGARVGVRVAVDCRHADGRRLDSGDADTDAHHAAAVGARGHGQIEALAAAQDGDHDLFVVVRLGVVLKLLDTADLDAVHGYDQVFGQEAGVVSGHVALDRVNVDALNYPADLVGHVQGSLERCGVALDSQRDCLIEIVGDQTVEGISGLDFLPVDGGDDVPWLQPGLCRH